MKVYFRMFLATVFFVAFVMLFLTFGKTLFSYFSFLKPGIDGFFSIVGGDNSYVKFIVFFIFWFIIIFGFSYIALIVSNTYIWGTNLGSERRSALETLMTASRKEMVILVLAVDYILLSNIILVLIFQDGLHDLWEVGSFSFNYNLRIFWVSFFASFYIFLAFMHQFLRKIQELEAMEEHI